MVCAIIHKQNDMIMESGLQGPLLIVEKEIFAQAFCAIRFCHMAKGTKNIASAVSELISPVVTDLGYILWDVEYVKEGARWILRVTLDSENGITIDDCERVHRAIDPVLDEADPIENSYFLEVSSPGVERELRTEAHIAASSGERVEVRLYAPLDGAKSFTGILKGLEEGKIVLETPSGELALERSLVAKIKTVFEF